MTTQTNKLEQLTKEARQMIIKVADYCTGKVHWASSLSMVEIMTVLYQVVLKKNDRLIVSKGHGALALYVAMYQAGILSGDFLEKYQQNGSDYPEEITMRQSEGILCSTGSLGLGLPYGTGIALAAKRENKDDTVYIISGDGECDEGSVWEAVMLASQYCLDNIVLIVDYNHLQADGFTDNIIKWGSFSEKFKAFGWETQTVDGHNIPELMESFKCSHTGKPMAIIANTVKGKGISFMENDFSWHDRVLNKDLLDQARQEVGIC